MKHDDILHYKGVISICLKRDDIWMFIEYTNFKCFPHQNNNATVRKIIIPILHLYLSIVWVFISLYWIHMIDLEFPCVFHVRFEGRVNIKTFSSCCFDVYCEFCRENVTKQFRFKCVKSYSYCFWRVIFKGE